MVRIGIWFMWILLAFCFYAMVSLTIHHFIWKRYFTRPSDRVLREMKSRPVLNIERFTQLQNEFLALEELAKWLLKPLNLFVAPWRVRNVAKEICSRRGVDISFD